jgi:hypothetical protein
MQTLKYTRPPCPACKNPMVHSIEIKPGGAHDHFVYCAVGRCPSTAANNGAHGATLDEAIGKLENAIDEEASE